MSNFKLPMISPLAGSRLSNLFMVVKGNRIALKYNLKVVLTFILAFISSAFHWIDCLRFNKKVNQFVVKESPLFIIGHWRSGTTFLHNILTQDPASGFVSTYHAVFPNNLKSKWIFKTFMRIFMPVERPGDRMKISVNLPQEDEYAISNITHQSFYHFFYFPSKYKSLYNNYVRFATMTEYQEEDWKLKYRQMVIKGLINTNRKRAVLKNPVNTGRMRKLIEIFPEANFIFLVRNPIIVYLSTKKFFNQLFPTLNLEDFSNDDISSMILDLYPRILKDYLSDKSHINRNRIIEVRYEELVQNPMREIEKIYSIFDLSAFHKVQPVFQEYLKQQKEYKNSSYSIEQQELERVMSKFDFAMNHWNYSIPDELEVIDKNQKYGEKSFTI